MVCAIRAFLHFNEKFDHEQDFTEFNGEQGIYYDYLDFFHGIGAKAEFFKTVASDLSKYIETKEADINSAVS